MLLPIQTDAIMFGDDDVGTLWIRRTRTYFWACVAVDFLVQEQQDFTPRIILSVHFHTLTIPQTKLVSAAESQEVEGHAKCPENGQVFRVLWVCRQLRKLISCFDKTYAFVNLYSPTITNLSSNQSHKLHSSFLFFSFSPVLKTIF